MKIELDNVAKRFRLEWVLRNVSLSFEPGGRYAITGPNGSGKSTLMKILSGHLTPSKGEVHFFLSNKQILISEVYRHLAYAAPYIELVEEMTLTEAIGFQQQFKPFQEDLSTKDLISLLGFERSANKPIRNFSSGMKQRLKLALAICADTPLLLLDEPTTNLDEQGVGWYLALIDKFAANRTVIVASNVEVDYGFCEERVEVMSYKAR